MSETIITDLMKGKQSLEFVNYMKKVIDINYYSTAFANLMGFTIHGNYLQFKNYYELKEIPSDELLAEFFPEIESFKMVSQFWDRAVESALALGLKVDKDNTTKYFHVKFGGYSKFVLQPKPAFIKLLEEKRPNSGMSYEYTGDKVVKKHYLYIENKDDIKKVLALSKIEANPEDLEHLECYYTDNDFKVNLIYTTPEANKLDLKELDKETKQTYDEVVSFLSKHNKPIWYTGLSKSKKLSVYFTTTDDKNFIEQI
jgi:hypothetical protein